ncbi:AraC family transcriptional regulator with amidase-like domain [Saccharopolyspora erythraea NRRL 2338]|uniref:AraC-family transcriptional regulator n=2 Tax=Saccharopolyspora erythraea TaxID=1836 RepID=A4FBF3_SACEN|nr:helix-turn-helix domain-containing protein [Saccharopolyspora erythraea]EQD84730.1 AraC family transcriptional regulator [Saccharopolyspora erythraea D]PFG95159.1 AraC family transcriptional regulator with amidase-like domain [Saccharopolyspora erythraea NRRL 2338]QRK91827.1 helix-turn-helix domain-containing protein [Saccharopolyspora erythraea]CAM01378.1 putative AraC-family transcriptional regulator [Saccharopolyspora erythraea NRRL 2338]
MAAESRTAAHRVLVLGVSEVVGFDLTIPSQILSKAAGPDGEKLYDVRVGSLDGGPIRTSSGYSVLPEVDLEFLAEPDTLIVPGTYVAGPCTDGTLPADLAGYFAALPESTRVMSICTGAYVLAAAGLLAGRPATTHWAHVEHFRTLYPAVDLHPDVLFVDDGDVLTSAGVAAGIDLCLHVIRRDHGSEVANRAARRSVVPPWREGGQSQFIERPLPEATGDGTAAAREWMLERLAEPLTLAAMAERAGMSVRTFARKFRAETGCSPLDWLLQQRVEHARELLESTDLAVDRVAEQSGLGSGSSLRAHLRRKLGTTPMAYRRTFRTRTEDGRTEEIRA